MASNLPGKCCGTPGTLHEGTPTGEIIKIRENTLDAYLAKPSADKNKNAAVIYLPDIWGIGQNSKLVADAFAANGYTTIIPDVFDGDVFPGFVPGLDIVEWISKGTDGKQPHGPEAVDKITVATIEAVKGLGIENIAAVGYCFGAKYVVRNYKNGIKVGFVAHPSFVDEEELAAISGPLSIAAAEVDQIFPAEKRHKSEEILIKTGVPFQINLYSGTEHGFAVRGDPKVKSQKFAKEKAFEQAVEWFNEHL